MFENRPFPCSLVPLFQSESKCKTILMKMTLIYMRMKLHAELIFIWKVSHLDSFWSRGTRELGNGLFDDDDDHYHHHPSSTSGECVRPQRIWSQGHVYVFFPFHLFIHNKIVHKSPLISSLICLFSLTAGCNRILARHGWKWRRNCWFRRGRWNLINRPSAPTSNIKNK